MLYLRNENNTPDTKIGTWSFLVDTIDEIECYPVEDDANDVRLVRELAMLNAIKSALEDLNLNDHDPLPNDIVRDVVESGKWSDLALVTRG